jgi:hypothetical protein
MKAYWSAVLCVALFAGSAYAQEAGGGDETADPLGNAPGCNMTVAPTPLTALERAGISGFYLPVTGQDARQRTANALFGSWSPGAGEAYVLLQDPLTKPIDASGYTGIGETFTFSVADANEACNGAITDELWANMGLTRMRVGWAAVLLKTNFGYAYTMGLWFANNGQWVYFPVGYLSNADSLFYQMNHDLPNTHPVPPVPATCTLDAQGQLDWDAFKVQWRRVKEENTTRSVIGFFGCGTATVLTCFTPVVAIPVLGPVLCATSAGCTLNAICGFVYGSIGNCMREAGYHDCICLQVQARMNGQTPPACERPKPAGCI